MSEQPKSPKLTYAASGVDIDAGDEAVRRIKAIARSTFGPAVLTEIGTFGGFFKPDLGGVGRPVLVASADGVGTKLKLAFMTGNHTTIGEDLVNHCINDILVHGAHPLFFLDYIATGKLEPGVIEQIVTGLGRGCRNAGVALLGGETAEMPDFYQGGEYDLAGFIVGMVDEQKAITGRAIKKGDICLGLPSTGLHTNGYSLARKVCFEAARLKPQQHIAELGMSIAESLMAVHRCYLPTVITLLESHPVAGMAHITGGGLPGNLNRILPPGTDAQIRLGSWPVLPIFDFLEKTGNLDRADMYRAFNMGIGWVIVASPEQVAPIIATLRRNGEAVHEIGVITDGTGLVRLV